MRDRELLRVATLFHKALLAGQPSDRMCFMLSAALSGFLKMRGVDTLLTEEDFGDTNHVFLKLNDGSDRVLDATIDQFSSRVGKKLPSVYLGPMPEFFTRWSNEARKTREADARFDAKMKAKAKVARGKARRRRS